jgi:hypothetical protein
MSQPALKHIYLSVIVGTTVGSLVSVIGSYITNQPINITLARHEKLHEHSDKLLQQHGKTLEQHGKTLEQLGKVLRETNAKVNDVERILRRKKGCFLA